MSWIGLRIVYKDNKLTFNDLLELDDSVSIHERNVQKLATEIFKVKNSVAPEIMTGIFEMKEPNYHLRSDASHFNRKNVKSTRYGMQSLWHLGPNIWNIVPKNTRESNSLNKFKSLMKFWKPDTCPCRICKNFIPEVDFIWSYMHRNYLSFLFNFFFVIVGVS